MSEEPDRVATIFHAVAEAPPERRASLLAELCADDEELRALVERLLAHDKEGMPGFLHPPTRATETLGPPQRSDPSNLRIGPYQILEVIAEGGMGTVYAAHQSKPVERDVALKVIRVGMDSKHVIARFEAERQALALMDHPNIAKVLDAGETDQGQPYFVMELIKGVPITEYCDHRRLTMQARLELFRPVCEAVQHAHQKAVIHRDLKPSNILVAEIGGRPLPKVIDFGVAKATARRLTERTMFTEQGVMIGTLEYMSPEQANLTGEDVDTRADVYSLGVILYELLSGTLPFAAQGEGGGGYEEIRRRILEDDPIRPSTRISDPGVRSTECAKSRGTDVATLRRQLRGDLDWIVIKALEKDRARRYASPIDLAADITRHLNDEPVVAQPPSTAYRARKFVRRHRLAVAATALVTLALLAAVVGTSAGLVRARRAETSARAEQARSEKAAAFLAGTLSGIDPRDMGQTLASTLRDRRARQGRAAGGPAPVPGPRAGDVVFEGVNMIDVGRSLVDAEILGKAVERIEKELEEEPVLAADLYEAIGDAYDSLNLFPPAVNCYERAVQLSARARGRDATATNRMRNSVGGVYQKLGRLPDAERIQLETIESLRRTLGEDAPETLMATLRLGIIYEDAGRPKEAEPLFRKALEKLRTIRGEDDPSTLASANALGNSLLAQRRYAEGEALLQETIERTTRTLGRDDIRVLYVKSTLARAAYESGRVKEAEQMMLELVEGFRRIEGDESQTTLFHEMKLGEIYLDLGRYDEAEGLLRNSAARLPLVLGEQHPDTQRARIALARLDNLRSHRRERAVAK